MNDGGGCGQQLVMRQEIYFRDYREHSLEYADVYPDIRAGLLRSIMRNASARGILAIRHGTLLPRLDAWLLPVRGRAGPPAAELADRRGPPPECAAARPARRAGLTHNSFLTVFSARNMRSAICRFVSPSDELQDALLLVRQRRQQVGGRHLSLESMWIVSRNSCHLRPKP